MDFKTYIDTEITANQDDPISNQVILIIRDDKNFPKTSDIKSVASHICEKLENDEQTTAFKKLLMLWKFVENNYQQPTDPNLLEEINYITDLRNRNQ